MPAARLSRRRRSSLGIALSTPVKPGTYGITTSPRNVTFAPNITPGTYIEDTEGCDDPAVEPPSPSDALFPPAEAALPSVSRRRAPPGKRRSQGYIPRPPNAFMLFRANFVRQKHVPGSIETNHGSLSKIIGNCWKALPESERKVWDGKAKKAKAEHQKMYPDYRFRPVHNKNKKNKSKVPVEPSDERRCEEVAQLLLEGKKGDELAAAVRRLDLDRAREATGSQSPMHAPMPIAMPAPFYAQHRRSSSVPPPSMYHPIAIPTMPFFAPQQDPCLSRPESPLANISRSLQRMLYGQRRASSAEPRYYNNWGMAPSFDPADLQTDHEPLPDVDASLFDPLFLNTETSFGLHMPQHMFDGQHCDPNSNPALALQISPLDHLDNGLNSASTWSTSAMTSADPLGNSWMHLPYEGHSASGSPSAFSVTPPPTEAQTPPHMSMYAPSDVDYTQMQHVSVAESQSMEDLGMNVHHQIDMNYNPIDGSVADYQACLDHSQQMFTHMSTQNHQYMPELEVQY
ncbi:hypothetical protein BC835DRAFT_1416270 [Cytidiella melzeri]|nr:hypothetical protein BC835DRAFT_1416270 [Cytidiella melzeri]